MRKNYGPPGLTATTDESPPLKTFEMDKLLSLAREIKRRGPNDTKEIEVRFNGEGVDYNYSVPRVWYDRLQNYLDQSQLVRFNGPILMTKVISEKRTDVGNATETRRHVIGDDIDLYQKKVTLKEKYDTGKGAVISFSYEKTITPVTLTNNILRHRSRREYQVVDMPFLIHLTTVAVVENNTARPEVYEVEMEYTGEIADFGNHITAMLERIDWLISILRDTKVVYTISEHKGMVSLYTRSLKLSRRGGFDSDILVQSRNLKLKDLVLGGIVSSKPHGVDVSVKAVGVGDPSKDDLYGVSVKADGVRKMLIFQADSSGMLVWLAYPPLEYNLIYRGKGSNITRSAILDGELVTLHNGKEAFLVFDCLFFNGKDVTTVKDYNLRLFLALQTIAVIKGEVPVELRMKHVYWLDRENFFDTISTVLEEEQDFDTDGLIFTPIWTNYDTGSSRLPMNKRVLTLNPDICKWKPPNRITIDFRLRFTDPNSFPILLCSGRNGEEEFKGEDLLSESSGIDRTTMAEKIVEMRWASEQEKPYFEVVRIRNDKKRPNSIKIALDNWGMIRDPIERATLEGEDGKLAFQHTNRIKRDLIDTHCRGKYIVDLGSGRGGDLSKWKYSEVAGVIAVEPDPDNYKELLSRLRANPNKAVFPINCKAEDTKTIMEAVKKHFPGGKADIVTMMLSMSFFWSSEATLDSLVRTIKATVKRDGKVVFTTIDGDNLSAFFELPGTYKVGSAVFELSNNSLHRTIGELAYFTLEEEGVIIKGKQEEWLVYPHMLADKLGGSMLKTPFSTDELLSQEYKDYVSLYSSGVITLNQRDQGGAVTAAKRTIVAGLPVTLKGKSSPAVGDDESEHIRCSWTKESLMRIATIGDGSCFFHALLKAMYPIYQENQSENERRDMVIKFRSSLSEWIFYADTRYINGPSSGLYSYWFATCDNPSKYFYALMGEESQGEGTGNPIKVARSLRDFRLYVGEEFIDFIGQVLELDIYIGIVYNDDFVITSTNAVAGQLRDSVVIGFVGGHYETIALETSEGLVTLHRAEDSFTRTLSQRMSNKKSDDNPLESLYSNMLVYLENSKWIKDDEVADFLRAKRNNGKARLSHKHPLRVHLRKLMEPDLEMEVADLDNFWYYIEAFFSGASL